MIFVTIQSSEEYLSSCIGGFSYGTKLLEKGWGRQKLPPGRLWLYSKQARYPDQYLVPAKPLGIIR